MIPAGLGRSDHKLVGNNRSLKVMPIRLRRSVNGLCNRAQCVRCTDEYGNAFGRVMECSTVKIPRSAQRKDLPTSGIVTAINNVLPVGCVYGRSIYTLDGGRLAIYIHEAK